MGRAGQRWGIDTIDAVGARGGVIAGRGGGEEDNPHGALELQKG